MHPETYLDPKCVNTRSDQRLNPPSCFSIPTCKTRRMKKLAVQTIFTTTLGDDPVTTNPNPILCLEFWLKANQSQTQQLRQSIKVNHTSQSSSAKHNTAGGNGASIKHDA